MWVGLLACLFAPLALYAVLPVAAAAGLRYLLRQQGYQHVTMQLGYPGWRTLQVPLISFQKDFEVESLSVTVQDSLLEYDLGALFSGRVHRLTIPYASVSWRGRSGNAGQPCAQSQTAIAGPGRLASVTVGHLLQPVPELPWRDLVVEQVHVFRECATGPLRDVRISGMLHKIGASADGAVVFQGTGSAAYRLLFAVSHLGSIEATLQAEPPAPGPIVVVQSHVSQGPSGVQLAGRTTTDFAQLAPFLALVLPLGADLQHVTGTMQATWTATAPPASSLAAAWQEPAAVVSGTVALTLRLPKFAGVGDHLSVRFNGEVTGNAEQLAWTLSKDARLEVELERATFPLPNTLQWLLPQQDRRVVIECPESIKGYLRLADTPLQFKVEGPIRAQYGAAQVTLQTLHGDHSRWQTAGVLSLSGVSPQLPTVPLPVTHWEAGFAVDDAALRLEAKSTAFGEAVTLVSRLEYRFAAQAGSVHLQLNPVQFDPSHVSWRTVVPLELSPVDVTGGRLSATASLTWGLDAGALDHKGKPIPTLIFREVMPPTLPR